MMTSMNPEVPKAAPNGAPPKAGIGSSPGTSAHRIILYERLTGDAARQRAMQPEPQGAGMPPEAVGLIEYVEVWSTATAAGGYDFRCYSFGGTLIASRSTRDC